MRGLVSICLGVVFFLSGCEGAGNSLDGVSIRKMALESLDGKSFKISWRAQKPIILNVWATWCAPCVKELPSLKALQKKGDFAVLAVAIDQNPAVVKTFLKANGFEDLPVAWDKNGRVIREHLGLRGVPTTFIIDQNQMVVGLEQGERTWDHPDMVAKINAYLSKEEEKAP